MNLVRKVPAKLLIEILANLVLPYVIYLAMEGHIGQVRALLAASLPPIIFSMVEFAVNRKLDAMSVLVLAGIVLSLLAFIGGGSVRFLQLRENLVSGLIGLIFLGSAAIGRPLIYYLARATEMRKSAAEGERLEKLRDNQKFRRTMNIMTLVWGFGLIAQTAVACVLVFRMSIANYLIVSPIVSYGATGCLTLWTVLYAKQQKRRAASMQPTSQS
jgi:hypothetical protein